MDSFFVMALVEGESLGAYIKRDGRAPLDFTRRVLRDVADALAYAHGRAIIHRDIKPDNILIDRVTGRTLVSDFGIARAAEGDSRLTVTGVAVGTPAYMSPEQATGEREIDGRSDLYSLGVVGYQTLTGELPFAANTAGDAHEAHQPDTASDPRTPAGCPPGLERTIERAMARNRTSAGPMRPAFGMRSPTTRRGRWRCATPWIRIRRRASLTPSRGPPSRPRRIGPCETSHHPAAICRLLRRLPWFRRGCRHANRPTVRSPRYHPGCPTHGVTSASSGVNTARTSAG
jgi:serine/threonine protein kinase